MYSGGDTRALPRVGFPIRRSRDQRLVSTSPGLFAAAHVLHRLLAPRHPPCALRLLIVKNTLYATMEFSRCTPALVRPNEKAARMARSLKTQQYEKRRVRHCSRRARNRTICVPRARPKSGTEQFIRTAEQPTGVKSSGFPRKEVIQPQLPLRLPCYDFTPVTDHSLVSALPRVRLPTSGATDSHGVTGGVYKARERIHRSVLISDY